PGEDAAHKHIKNRPNEQARDYADGHVPLRVARFFGRGGDGVESDEGEEHDGRSAHHARETARHKWMPIRRMHQEGTEGDDENDYRYLGHNDPGVGLGALANSV